MADTIVRFSEPIVHAFERMARILFQPFSLEKWIVIGFAAWLAGLASGGVGNVSWVLNGTPSRAAAVPVESGSGPVLAVRSVGEDTAAPPVVPVARTLERLRDFDTLYVDWSWFLAGCVAIAFCFVLAVVVVLLWLSSRATFVFLDDVVRDAAEIVQPWRQYGRLGNSLFVWRLMFWLVVLTVIGVGAAGAVGMAGVTGSPVFLAPWIFALAVFVPAVVFVDVFLRHFVVPVMYRHELGTTAAWGRFLGLFRREPMAFLVYGLLLVALWMGVGAAVLVLGLFTCCLGLLFVALPYVGTVLLLPVHVFFRQLGLEFLAQFGAEFDARSAAAAVPPPGNA